MKPAATIAFFFFLFSLSAQEGYNIKITVKPLNKQYVYIGHYYGRETPVIDSVFLNEKSEGTWKGQNKPGDGIYFIALPAGKGTFPFIIDKNYSFEIIADTSQVNSLKFSSSPENVFYNKYQQTIRNLNQKLQATYNLFLNKQGDSALLVQQLDRIQDSINAFRQQTVKQHPNALIAAMLKTMLDPEVPENHPDAAKDSMFAYKYFKKHYWDNMNFYEDRMVRTPFLEGKLDNYFNELVYPNADSILKEIDWMVGYASASPFMQKYLLEYFLKMYMGNKAAWTEDVFVTLYEKYFASKSYPWLDEYNKKIITARANAIMANATGKPAADIELPDASGAIKKLYGVDAPYTLVAIWDVTCPHCRQVLPKIDSIYQAKWKKLGLQIFSFSKESDGTREHWLQYITDKKLQDWTHVYYSKKEDKERQEKGLKSYSQLYNVLEFPTFYLLDKDKRIIAKKLSYQQMDEILQLRTKK